MNGKSAWERWELANFDTEVPATNTVETEEAPTATGPSQQEIDRVYAEARDNGYRAGYAAGQATARAEATRLAHAADELAEAMSAFDQQVADELVALAMEVARQIIRGEVTARPAIILDVVHEALAQLPHQHVTIYLHPDDASLVRSYAGDALTHAGHRILEDLRLTPGDCVLESGTSQLDASLATRWRRVVEGLGLRAAWDRTNEP